MLKLLLSFFLIFIILFLACAEKKVWVLTGERTICEDCGKIIEENVKKELVPQKVIRSDPFQYRTAFREEYDYEKLDITKVICDVCMVERERVEEEKRREAEIIKRKQAQMAKLVKGTAWIETTSLTPIDYLVHTTLKNKTSKTLKVTYEVACTNFSTPTLFLATGYFENTLRPQEHAHYTWHPSEEIQDLRNSILEKGAELSKEEIKALKSDQFKVSVELKDVITPK